MDDYNQPVEFLREEEVANDGNKNLVESELSLKIGVQSSKGVRVVGTRLVVKEGDQ
jgi:hypothetical protein